IWVFPDKKNVAPRYDQKYFSDADKLNKLQIVVSPIGSDDDGVQIHQSAWFSMGKLEKGFSTVYSLKKKENGVYVFVIEGDVTINGEKLNRRDGLGITESEELEITADSDAEVLLMEVPV